MEKETDIIRSFDMSGLRTNLPQKRGLSRYYSGKSRSFTCMVDARFLEDLKKQHPETKKRKTVHSDKQCMQASSLPPPYNIKFHPMCQTYHVNAQQQEEDQLCDFDCPADIYRPEPHRMIETFPFAS